MGAGIEVAKMETRGGKPIVVVAVRSDVLQDKARRRATLDVLTSVFPEHEVVLAASASDGFHYAAESPEVAEKVRRKRSPLSWQRVSVAV